MSERVRASQSESEWVSEQSEHVTFSREYFFYINLTVCRAYSDFYFKEKCVVLSFYSDATMTNATMIVSAIY